MTSPTDSPISRSSIADGADVDAGVQRDVRIRMDDGVTLAATLYLPNASLGPQPCILEALPYRKDDLTSSYRPDYARLRDDHNYAVCRVDLRGTGSSAGDAIDEYPEREQQDLAATLTWLARQEWCDGNLGMYGTSYSGFNSLQMACEQPEELKAIIAIYATDDRYTDDVHYRGGLLKLIDLVDYNHYMTPMNALPPVPALWGDDWRDEWQRRIDTNEPWLVTWMREQRSSAYWSHGSVRPGYERIQCPTMIIAGWADGYRNNSFRTIERLRENGVPHRLLAGPWAHVSTETSLPGPRIDSMPEMVAWWDRWLRGIETGVDDGQESPAVTCFVRASTRPEPDLDESRGEWVREEWPCPRIEPREFTLDSRPVYAVHPAVGTDAWIDCAGHLPYGQSLDQRFDDAASLTWDFDADDMTVLGHPIARLQISADTPVATCSVKLCDVWPDGASALVSRGTLNLTHRADHADLSALEAGRVYDVTIELDACAYRFESGQRLRLSIAGSDWPNTAASPSPVTLTLHGGTVTLPRWLGPSPYGPPLLSPASAGRCPETADGVTWTVERDVLGRQTRCTVDHGSTSSGPHGVTSTEHYSGVVTVEHLTYRQTVHANATFELAWPEATAATHATMNFVADSEAYEFTIELVARDGDAVFAQRRWHERVARDLA